MNPEKSPTFSRRKLLIGLAALSSSTILGCGTSVYESVQVTNTPEPNKPNTPIPTAKPTLSTRIEPTIVPSPTLTGQPKVDNYNFLDKTGTIISKSGWLMKLAEDKNVKYEPFFEEASKFRILNGHEIEVRYKTNIQDKIIAWRKAATDIKLIMESSNNGANNPLVEVTKSSTEVQQKLLDLHLKNRVGIYEFDHTRFEFTTGTPKMNLFAQIEYITEPDVGLNFQMLKQIKT